MNMIPHLLPQTSTPFLHLLPKPHPHHHHHPFPSLPKSLTLTTKPPLSLSSSNPFPHSPICKAFHPKNEPTPQTHPQTNTKNSFWAAVTLIVGTAVGPGMLGLPSATINAGPLPSTIAIVLSWLYVVSSILLVAELSCAHMKQNNVEEVSFTSLATAAFGPNFGAFVAVIYACLSFSLLVACVSGIGSLIIQQFPLINPILAHSLLPGFVAIAIGFFPFKVIDVTNRLLCSLMLFSITALVLIGVSLGKSSLLGSLSFAPWRLKSIMPAIPITVLTLGFHVITPFVCSIVGKSMYDARKAILFGGAVPLAMVLSWNAVVLGLAGSNRGSSLDPIELLLSVNSSALPAVQGFVFAALATSLIGYAVSLPKQLVDTVRLVGERFERKEKTDEGSNGDSSSSWSGVLVKCLVLVAPTFIAYFFPSSFSKALDFAGVYANCFLFGILPPVMAWMHRSSNRYRLSKPRENLLPGGPVVLVLLFVIAVILGFWH